MSVLEQGRKYIIVRKVMNKRQAGIKRITKGIERDRNSKKRAKRKSERVNKRISKREKERERGRERGARAS